MKRPHLVAGIDGSESAWHALEWAADDAEQTGRRLLIAHAGDTAPVDGGDPTPFGTELLDDAVARVAEAHRRLEVETTLVDGDPAEVMLALALDADLLVLGRGRHTLRVARLGSVTDRILGEAPCPVTVLGPVWTPGGDTVVVGASESAGGVQAMRFACEHARLRGAEVVAVRSWSAREYRLAASAALPITSPDVWERSEQTVLDQYLAKARAEFPDLVIRAVLSREPAEIALEREARTAAVLVVGCRRADDARLPRLGAITSWVVRHIDCPVVVVGHHVHAGVA